MEIWRATPHKQTHTHDLLMGDVAGDATHKKANTHDLPMGTLAGDAIRTDTHTRFTYEKSGGRRHTHTHMIYQWEIWRATPHKQTLT